MIKILKKFRLFLISSLAIVIITFVNKEIGMKAIETFQFSLKEMIFLLPPVFILLGLLDVWVPREVMIKYMGEGSGIVGVLLSIFIGSAAAGPLYGAFPIAAVFMNKGVKLSNILVLIGAWSTTKIPMILFEISSLGPKFALTRLALSIPGILIIAYILPKLLKQEEIEDIYKRAAEIE